MDTGLVNESSASEFSDWYRAFIGQLLLGINGPANARIVINSCITYTQAEFRQFLRKISVNRMQVSLSLVFSDERRRKVALKLFAQSRQAVCQRMAEGLDNFLNVVRDGEQ